MIILTGSKGFIGQNFLKYLIEHSNEEIITVDEHECWDWISFFEDWDKVSLILHQGAISNTTERDIDKLHRMNVWFTIELFEKAIEHQIDVKFASSASVYGNTRKSLWATTPNKISPLNYYAITKLQIDYYIQDNLDKFSSIQSFRYFNVYGQGEEEKIIRDQSSPISKFIYQAKKDGVIRVFENSKIYFRDFICVDDLLNIILDNTRESGIYDLGTSNPRSFLEVANIVAKYYNAHVEYVPFPKHLEGKYQTYTMAKPEWGNYKFKTIEDYVKDSLD